MEFNVNKITTTDPIQQPSGAGSAATSAPVSSSKPVDTSYAAKQAERVEQENADLNSYINSPEFKKLKPEEQAAVLKEKFFPASSVEDVQKNLGTLKQQAEISQSTTTKESGTPSAAPETSTPESETPMASTPENQEPRPDTRSEIEIAAENYMKQTGKSFDSIEELRYALTNKPDKTEEEIKLLDSIKAADTANTSTKESESKTKKSGIEDFKQFFTPEWNKLTPEKKVNELARKYLSETDENFKNLPVKAQNKELKNFLKSINAEMASRNASGKQAMVLELVATFETLKDSGLSMAEFNKLSQSDRTEIIGSTIMKKFNAVAEELIPESTKQSDEWKNSTEEQKLLKYADAILKEVDPQYAKMADGDAKTKYLEEKTNSFIDEHIFKGWKDLESRTKEFMLQDIIATKTMLEKANISYAKFKQSSPEEQKDIKEKFKPKSDNPAINLKNDLAAQLIKDGYKVKDFPKKMLEMLNKKQNLTPEEQELKNILTNMVKTKAHPPKSWYTSIETLASNKNMSVEDYVNYAINSKKKELIRGIVNGADGCPELQKEILEKLKRAGYSEKQLNELTEEYSLEFNSVYAVVKKDPKMMIATKASRAMTGNLEGGVKWINAEYKACQTLEAKKELHECNMQYQEYIDPATKAIYDRNIISTPEESAAISAYALSSKNVPDANKALASNLAVYYAAQNSPEEAVYTCRELSKIDSPAVTEGLAAASKYVTDPAARKQYDSYVDNAMKNYPPEQQETIRQARETGEISSKTLEQTGTKASAETSSSAKNQATGETQKTSAGNTSSGKVSTQAQVSQEIRSGQNTTEDSIRTGVSTTPKVSNSDSTVTIGGVSSSGIDKTSNTTSTTSVSSYRTEISSMNDAEAEKLTQEAEAVLTKIENFLEAQSESIKQWEERQTSDTTAEEAATSLSEDDVIEAAVNGDSGSLADVNLSVNEKETLRKTITAMFENNSTSAAYQKLVTKFGEGAKTKFLQAFAQNADSASIRMFADDFKNDSQVISLLYQYSQDSSLIAYLPKDEIFNLLMKGKISDLSKIDPNILSDFIQEKMKTEKNPQNLRGYLNMLPLEYQGAIMSQYPDLAAEVRGSDEWNKRSNTQDSKTKVSENPKTTEETTAPKSKTAFVPDENINLFNNIDDFQSFEAGPLMASNRVPHNKRGSGGNKDYDKLKRKHVWVS